MPTILVVDDSFAAQTVIAKHISNILPDHQIIKTNSALKAYQLITTQHPILVVSDWNMPGWDGLWLLNKLRTNNNPVPFGFISSTATPEFIAETKAAGALFHLPKPFSTKQLEQVLQPYKTPTTNPEH